MDTLIVLFLVLCGLGYIAANRPPSLTDQSHYRQIVKVKQTKKINCPVEADPAPIIQWIKDGQYIDEWDRYRVLQDGSLRIKDIIMEDAGTFVCKAVNGFGSILVNYTIIVINSETEMVKDKGNFYPLTPEEDLMKEGASPRFTMPEKMKKKEIQRPVGSSVRLKCRANGNPRPRIAWLKDNQVIESDDANEKKPTWTLKLQDLKEENSGRYTCLVSNRLGTINYTYTLEVIEKFNEKPVLVAPHPLNTTVGFGQTASLQCKVESAVQPHIQWLKRVDDISEVQNQNTTLRLDNQQFIVLKTGEVWNGPDGTYLNKLVIKNAKEKDAGVYICLGANAMGYNVRSAYLTVMGDPQKSHIGSGSGSSSLPLVIAVPTCIVVLLVIVAIILLQRRKSCSSATNTNMKNPRFNPVPTQETDIYPAMHNNPTTNLHINPMHGIPVHKNIYTGVQNPHLIQNSREKLSKNHSIDFYTDISSVSQSRNTNSHPHMTQYSY